MADLLFDLLPVAWQEKKFKMHDIALANFTEEELRSRFRFGRESIEFLVQVLREDLERQTSRNHAFVANCSSTCGATFLRLRKLPPSDWRYRWPAKINCLSHNS